VVRDRALLPEADLVLFHIPSLRPPIDIPRYPGQRWVAYSMESEANYPLLAYDGFMRQFDLTMTYQRSSDVWTPYFGRRMAERLLSPTREKTEPAPAVYFASNPRDRSGRQEYARALMRYLQVDSYGRCLNNRRLEVDQGSPTKLETIARYRFTLAFENSIAPDYVTEKFYEPLIAGSVPVYLGAPNVAELAPAERCFVNVADFDGPRDLADFLRVLGADSAQYDEYLSWKQTGFSNSFKKLLEELAVHPICRLCLKAHGLA
jgi:hypothetical protein